MRPTKGFVLAAGLGKRLRPLTAEIPKPMVPFCGLPVLWLALSKIRETGIQDCAVNTHHLPEKIRLGLNLSSSGRDVVVSHEPVLMDTGGAYLGLSRWLGDEAVLVHNGDIVSDFDLRQLVEAHALAGTENLATITVLSAPRPGTNPVWCKDGRLVGIGGLESAKNLPSGATPHTMTGIYIASGELRRMLPAEGPSSILVAWERALREGKRISVVPHEGLWFDLGDPKAYLNAHLELLQALEGLSEEARQTLLERLGLTAAARTLGRTLVFCAKNDQKSFEDVKVVGPVLLTGPALPKGCGHLGPYVCASGLTQFCGQTLQYSVVCDAGEHLPASGTCAPEIARAIVVNHLQLDVT